jgi:hypothetical protein
MDPTIKRDSECDYEAAGELAIALSEMVKQERGDLSWGTVQAAFLMAAIMSSYDPVRFADMGDLDEICGRVSEYIAGIVPSKTRH